MRFGFKTSPQNTSWDAMLEVWRAADDIDVFEFGWTSDHFHAIHDADPGATTRSPPPTASSWGLPRGAATGSRKSARCSPACCHRRRPRPSRGRYYNLTEARCNPKPVQQPHPPLCVGGSGEKRTLRTAARFAQHWNFDSGTLAQFTRAREVLHQHCADVGRDPGEILLSAQVLFTGDPSATAAAAATLAGAGADLAIVQLRPPYTAAVLEPLAEALSAL